MGRATLPGNPPIEIVLKASGRARRVSLRVSALDGQVTATYPRGYPVSGVMDFAREKQAWITRQVTERAPVVQVAVGGRVPVEGLLHDVVAGPGRVARTDGAARLLVPAGTAGAAAQAFLKTLARDRLAAAISRHAQALGETPGRLTLRDTRSRWGSCSSRGDLMFSWRLVMAPPEVLDYVAAHEVAHLRHMHHGAAFWHEVERLFGPTTQPRGWLKRNGSELHRYRFKD